ncbi:MAG: hypothetical protein ACK5Y2_11490, partial [Bdellovibrionales bacterium]
DTGRSFDTATSPGFADDKLKKGVQKLQPQHIQVRLDWRTGFDPIAHGAHSTEKIGPRTYG